MRKIICLISVLILSLCMLVGCSDNNGTPKETQLYQSLNTMISRVNSFDLTISTTTKGETLNSNYSIIYDENGYDVVYSYDILNKIDLSNPVESYKSTKSGTAKIVNGSVESYTGDEINAIPSKLSLSFKEEYFTNVVTTDNTLTAEVMNSKMFFGGNVEISGMKISVLYPNSILKSIEINYSTLNSIVKIIYSIK